MGKEGAFRKLNIGPETRIEELRLRRKMLQAHQWLVIITLAGLAYQYDVVKNFMMVMIVIIGNHIMISIKLWDIFIYDLYVNIFNVIFLLLLESMIII